MAIDDAGVSEAEGRGGERRTVIPYCREMEAMVSVLRSCDRDGRVSAE